MSGRRIRETPRYVDSLRRLKIHWHSRQFEALTLTARALAAAALLPGPLDYEVGIPPVYVAWCRRVPGQNLWLFYQVREDSVLLLHVKNTPPIPLD